MWNKLPLSVCQAPTPVLRRVQGTSCYQDMTDFQFFIHTFYLSFDDWHLFLI